MFLIYAKKGFSADYSNKNVITSKILVMTQENMEELLMIFKFSDYKSCLFKTESY